MGPSKRAIYAIPVSQSYLEYVEWDLVRIPSYDRFMKRLKGLVRKGASSEEHYARGLSSINVL